MPDGYCSQVFRNPEHTLWIRSGSWNLALCLPSSSLLLSSLVNLSVLFMETPTHLQLNHTSWTSLSSSDALAYSPLRNLDMHVPRSIGFLITSK